VGAGGIELRDEYVEAACTDERSTSEVDGAFKVPRDDEVARFVHGESVAELLIRVAGAMAPDVIAVGVELRDIDVVPASTYQRTATEVHGALEGTGHEHVAGFIRRDRVGVLGRTVAEALAPRVNRLVRPRRRHQQQRRENKKQTRSDRHSIPLSLLDVLFATSCSGAAEATV